MKKLHLITSILLFLVVASCQQPAKKSRQAQQIDRRALVERNHPHITAFDSLASFTVGNGEFAMTVDATGLQSFPCYYSNGVPLGTQSQWGWHSFPNTENYQHAETLKDYDFGRGRKESYSVQFDEGRPRAAANYFRENPHRLHLGIVGLEFRDDKGQELGIQDITDIEQTLELWNGSVNSFFSVADEAVEVTTVCDPSKDMVAAAVNSALMPAGQMNIKLHFSYPTGKHADDAMDWQSEAKHVSRVVEQSEHYALIERRLDNSTYYVWVKWEGKARFKSKGTHYFVVEPQEEHFAFSCLFTKERPALVVDKYDETEDAARHYWNNFWQQGGAVDFSQCTDARAPELERRVVLSQYLMAIQSAGSLPPQETGLTYNSWFGKHHLEMHWWHAAHFALWGRLDLLERSMDWYQKVAPVAREIARRQGYEGVRWMKMTDPDGGEAPSGVGSFLIWQQPHFIYFSELIYRQKQNRETLDKYKKLVFETAEFMASFASWDDAGDRYVLKGVIPAQETLKASETVNPPFELAYWRWGLATAQKWRERLGMERDPRWDDILQKLAPLAQKEGLYLAAETAPQTYEDVRFTSDHMAVLGALGILPDSRLVDPEIMRNTLHWVWDNWNWDHTWGWDYPMTAMCAARLSEPEKAVGALLMDKRTNTYLPNGHNYQDKRLRVYLPGNGGLLTAVAMMAAGWDGSNKKTPGFPDDGTWNVQWEGLEKMP
ncbi:hypothetical protein [Marinilabilia salmonicolor]|uniref:Glycosyl hydrolase family 65 n=1 Tax=Marinilabilia salmonicolor TaxID=989 RepID=A0A368UWS5_9BACT|nr:hypothetical protein [Marinilabilia salmonicolor]RCW32535.1 hypothetical protein DFO77_11580 [Marinilabilia salmonicolor]